MPPEVHQPLLYRREETTGKILSKRQIAPLIIDAIENRSDCNQVVRQLIEIAAH